MDVDQEMRSLQQSTTNQSEHIQQNYASVDGIHKVMRRVSRSIQPLDFNALVTTNQNKLSIVKPLITLYRPSNINLLPGQAQTNGDDLLSPSSVLNTPPSYAQDIASLLVPRQCIQSSKKIDCYQTKLFRKSLSHH